MIEETFLFTKSFDLQEIQICLQEIVGKQKKNVLFDDIFGIGRKTKIKGTDSKLNHSNNYVATYYTYR